MVAVDSTLVLHIVAITLAVPAVIFFALAAWYFALLIDNHKPGNFWLVCLLGPVGFFIEGIWTEDGLVYRGKMVRYLLLDALFALSCVAVIYFFGTPPSN